MRIYKNKTIVQVTGILCLTAFLMVATSCEQEDPFLDQIAKPTGKGYYPVIASVSVNPATSTPAGTDFSLVLRYWSQGTIESISLIEVTGTDSSEVFSTPYTPAYSSVSRTDSLIIDYSVPPATPVGTTYVVNVTNANSLKREQQVISVSE